MAKFPLLEQLRAERQRAEDEVAAPYRAELSLCAALVGTLKARLRSIEKLLGTDIARELASYAAHELSRELRNQILQAAAKSRGPQEPFNVLLTPQMAFMNPEMLEAQILQRYRDEMLPRLSLRVDDNPSENVTVVDIRIPEFGIRHAFAP